MIVTHIDATGPTRAIVYWRDGPRRVALPVTRAQVERAFDAAVRDHAIAGACLGERTAPSRPSFAEIGRRYGFSRQRAHSLIRRASAVFVRALTSKES